MVANQVSNRHSLEKQSPHRGINIRRTDTAGDSAITLQNIEVQYTDTTSLVLDIERLTVARGERIALVGPSGAGKTTLLRLLNGYVQPNGGQINILGNQINLGMTQRYPQHRDHWTRAMRRGVGFVFQDFSLVERATVFQNVLWGRLGRMNPLLSLFGWFSVADKMTAMEAINEVDLLPQTSQRVDTLSGGQQQRVGIARVLAQKAEIILADEPVSNLDPALAEDVLALLADVSQRHNATLLMSLHQPRLAQQYADRIIGLRAGRIVYDDRAEHFSQAAIQTIYGRSVGVNESLHNTGNETYAGDYSVPVQEWPIASAYAQVTP